MESILHTFGIDWRLLLVNGVNFGLLLAGLTYFLYTPVLSMLEERRQKVAAGVAAADEAQEKLSAIEQMRALAIADATKEADQLLAAAREAGHKKEAELVARGNERAEAALKGAAAEASELKRQALQKSKEEVAKLIVLGMEKLKKIS